VIKVQNGKLKGYNTDSDAFFETIEKWLPKDRTFKALITGFRWIIQSCTAGVDQITLNSKLFRAIKKW
jgi:hypothetical protein